MSQIFDIAKIIFYNLNGQITGGYMKQKAWAKTLLSIYTCLENISNAIDKYVVAQGVASGRNNLTTIESAERIINLIQRKKLMINIKVLIEKSIANLDTESARILVMRFVDKVKPEVCTQILNYSRRTYFRRLDKSIESFATNIKHQGIDENILQTMFKKEGWVLEIYQNFLKQKQKDVDFKLDALPDYKQSSLIKLKHCNAY